MTPRPTASIMRLAAEMEIHIAANLMINGEVGRTEQGAGA